MRTDDSEPVGFRHRKSSSVFGCSLLVSLAVFALGLSLGVTGMVSDASADSGVAQVSLGIKTVLSISTSPETALSIPLTPTGAGSYSARKLTVNVATNNLTGFTTTMSMADSIDGGTTPGTSLVNLEGDRISALATTSYSIDTAAALGVNVWGFGVPKSQTNTVGLLPNNTSNAFDATYSEVTSVEALAAKYAQLPSSGSPLTLKSTTAKTSGDATEVYFGARVDTGVPGGSYRGTVVFSAIPNYVPVPTIENVYLTGTTTHAWGPISGGTTIDIIGTDLDTANQVFIDKNANGVQDDGEQCVNPVVSATKITCVTPAHNANELRGVAVNTLGGQVIDTKGFSYDNPVEEIWGFTVDTSISTAVSFVETAPVALQVDFGSGTWTNFSQGATITGTAIPDAVDGPLSHIRVRPQNSSSFGWLPVKIALEGSSMVLDSMVHMKTLDYPITTRSISDSSGMITKTLGIAFYGATNLTTPVSFVNSNGVRVRSIVTDLLYGVHYDNTSLVASVDLSPLAKWDINGGVGEYFLSFVHYNNPLISTPIDLAPLADWNVSGAVEEGFLSYVHYGNTALTSAINLAPLADWGFSGAVGSFFANAAHYNNTNLVSPIDLSPLAGWKIDGAIGNNFLANIHEANTSMTSAIDLSPLSEWRATSIGDSFLFRAHRNSTAIATPVNLSGVANWRVSGSIGSNFLALVHSENTLLTAPVDLWPIANWAISGSIGDYFLYGTHYNNHALVNPISLAPLGNWNVSGSVGSYFLYATHFTNSMLTSPMDLSGLASWNAKSVGSHFLYSTHRDNVRLTSPLDLAPFASWSVSGSIGAYFLAYTHYGNSELTAPIDLSGFANWDISGAIGDRFLCSTHSMNSKLVAPVDFTPLANWNISGGVGEYFLAYLHRENLVLASPTSLAPLASWNVTSIAGYFLYAVHYNSPKLLNISSFVMPNWAKDKLVGATYAFHQAFYLTAATTTTGSEPKFVDGTFISSVGTPTATPTNRRSYTNRSSITPAIAGWK